MVMNTGVSFGLASDAYKSFRIEYPPALFTQIEHAGTSMRRNLAVDLGSEGTS